MPSRHERERACSRQRICETSAAVERAGSQAMKVSKLTFEQGNVLLCVLCTILVVSVIGGNVLLNCMTRYNVASGQVRSWKESLDAAETGGDIAYAEVRKTILDPTHAFSPTDWDYSGGVHKPKLPVTYGK